MIHIQRTIAFVAFALLLVAAAPAGLPLPDAVIVGELRIDGVLIPATRSDVAIIARRVVAGSATSEVGRYTMGARGSIGDKFTVRVRMESLANNTAAAANAIRVGDTIRLFVKEGAAAERSTGVDLTVASSGKVFAQNLAVGVSPPACPTDVNHDGRTDLIDLAYLLTNFGLSGNVTHEQGDVDADNDVDLNDLALILINFGLPCPP